MSNMSRKKRQFTREFKMQIVQAYEGGTSAVELGRRYDVHQNLIYSWADQYRANPDGAFRSSHRVSDSPAAAEQRIAELERMIGRLTVENDVLKKALEHAKSVLMNNKTGNTKP